MLSTFSWEVKIWWYIDGSYNIKYVLQHCYILHSLIAVKQNCTAACYLDSHNT